MKNTLLFLKEKLFTKTEVKHSEQFYQRVNFLNKYSYIFHALLSCIIVFLVEWVSRRSISSAFGFLIHSPNTYLYNAFIVYASLTLVYLFRRRAFLRLIISSFWIILGIINGVVLSNRVTPFNFSDLACLSDLFAMSDTNYFTPTLVISVVLGSLSFILVCVVFYIKGPAFVGRRNTFGTATFILIVLFGALPITTKAAQETNIVETYFTNIAQGYEESGFVYAFSSGVIDRGMDKPEQYTQEHINEILDVVDKKKDETTLAIDKAPNIICVLLESFVDPDEFNFMSYDKDPTPFFHYLEENFTTGYLNVPVIGAGTANSEFEILTGMMLNYFGTGEYPYKTVLKERDCESIASVLKNLGYGTHAVHNNEGNFYSRINAFSMMGFDTFTSEELMHITEFTPNESWAEDSVLASETIKTLLATENQPDFTYTITVGTHGAYPKEEVIDNPYCNITGIEDEGIKNQWTYYLHQLNKTDAFMAELIAELEKLDEDTIVVFWGDHLPTMGLTEEDMSSSDIYKTNYVTWNNFGLEKEDTDLYAYQLLSSILDSVGIHEGTMVSYHQTMEKFLSTDYYRKGLELLQYDILYGERYCYENGETPYPPTEIVMGVTDVILDGLSLSEDGTQYIITGKNFTPSCHVYADDKHIVPTFISDTQLVIDIKEDTIEDGATIVVSQMGPASTRYRDSNEYIYSAPLSTEQ